MARGIANGEGVTSQAQSKAWDENADRIGLGKSESSKERGRWVWDEKRQKLVRPWEYDFGNTEEARSAPVMVGRFYEGVKSPRGDGVVFQTRAQHKRYMREHGLTTADDYNGKGGAWDKAEKRREQGFSAPEQRKARREKLERTFHSATAAPQAKYDKEVAQRAQERRKRGTAEPTQ